MIAGAIASCSVNIQAPASNEPMPVIASPPPIPVLGAEAKESYAEPSPEPDLDSWSLNAREDGDQCRADLKAAGFKFTALPDQKAVDKNGCGIPHAVIVMKGPTGIVYDPPIMVDCTMARALSSIEKIVQEEAASNLHAKIARIANFGAFACRPRNYRKNASLSAHAFGSAIDVSAFHPVTGTPAIVLRDYPESAQGTRSTAAQDDRRRFLHAVLQRFRREGDLTYAIGPDFNAIHHNHFHLDRGGWHFWAHRDAPN